MRRTSWHHMPLCTMSDVSSRSALSYLGGAPETLGAVDKGTDALQEMSKKYLPKTPRTTITD